MKSLEYFLFIRRALLFTLCMGSLAEACLPVLQKTSTLYPAGQGDLCRLADRYAAAKESLRQRGVDATRIADVRAPRFIRGTDWTKHNKSLWTKSYDPRFIYDVGNQATGSVWAGWDTAATFIDTKAEEHYAKIASKSFHGFDFSTPTLLYVHNLALGPAEGTLAGKMRVGLAYGKAYNDGTSFTAMSAPTLQEIINIRNDGYKNTMTGKNIVTWESTACYEKLTSAEKTKLTGGKNDSRYADVESLPKRESPFQDSNGVMRQCGYYAYPNSTEVMFQLDTLRNDINSRMSKLLQASNGYQEEVDPVYIAARIQRWFVSIHPFGGGNGRTSRLLMDLVLQSLGLPAPILEDMDTDLTSSERQWSIEVSKGMEKTVQLLENCALSPSAKACQEVPQN